jgi:hypothetical protein
MARKSIIIPYQIFDAVRVEYSDGSGYFTMAVIDDTDFSEAAKSGCIGDEDATVVHKRDGVLIHDWMGKPVKPTPSVSIMVPGSEQEIPNGKN